TRRDLVHRSRTGQRGVSAGAGRTADLSQAATEKEADTGGYRDTRTPRPPARGRRRGKASARLGIRARRCDAARVPRRLRANRRTREATVRGQPRLGPVAAAALRAQRTVVGLRYTGALRRTPRAPRRTRVCLSGSRPRVRVIRRDT